MKTTNVLLLALVTCGALGTVAYMKMKTPKTTTAVSVPAQQSEAAESVTIPVEGMSCSACAAGLKKGLGKLDGVKSVEVDLGKRQVAVSFESARVTQSRLVDEINELGYSAKLPMSEPAK